MNLESYVAAMWDSLRLTTESRVQTAQRNLQNLTESLATPVPSVEEQERVREQRA